LELQLLQSASLLLSPEFSSLILQLRQCTLNSLLALVMSPNGGGTINNCGGGGREEQQEEGGQGLQNFLNIFLDIQKNF
jgi:hypothetical protein